MRLCMVGTGYVGLVSAACFAELGNRVWAVDVDRDRVEGLRRGVMPFHEPGLTELVHRNVTAGRLSFTCDLAEGAIPSDIIFIAVGTPARVDGAADLTQVEAVARELGPLVRGRKIVVTKSTVPVGTAERVRALITEWMPRDGSLTVASVPEFLREGRAVWDTFHPDRIVIGSDDSRAIQSLVRLHKPLEAQLLVTDLRSAELVKYASNAFLAAKISFINEMATLCEHLGADVLQVAEGMGMDKRIGPHFLQAGVGFGGACLPKDTLALVKMAESAGCPAHLTRAAIKVNQEQRERLIQKASRALGGFAGRTVAVLGLAFKPNTDDVRESPALDLIPAITAAGGRVRAYDPVASPRVRALLDCPVEYTADPYRAVEGADAVILLTEWQELKDLNLGRVRRLVRRPVFLDGRNAFDPAEMERQGFEYLCIGRPAAGRRAAASVGSAERTA